MQPRCQAVQEDLPRLEAPAVPAGRQDRARPSPPPARPRPAPLLGPVRSSLRKSKAQLQRRYFSHACTHLCIQTPPAMLLVFGRADKTQDREIPNHALLARSQRPSASTKSSSFHSPDGRLADACLSRARASGGRSRAILSIEKGRRFLSGVPRPARPLTEPKSWTTSLGRLRSRAGARRSTAGCRRAACSARIRRRARAELR